MKKSISFKFEGISHTWNIKVCHWEIFIHLKVTCLTLYLGSSHFKSLYAVLFILCDSWKCSDILSYCLFFPPFVISSSFLGVFYFPHIWTLHACDNANKSKEEPYIWFLLTPIYKLSFKFMLYPHAVWDLAMRGS